MKLLLTLLAIFATCAGALAAEAAEAIVAGLHLEFVDIRAPRLWIDTRPGDLSSVDLRGDRYRLISKGEFCPGTRYRVIKVERGTTTDSSGISKQNWTVTVRHEDMGSIHVFRSGNAMQPWSETIVGFRSGEARFSVKMGERFTVRGSPVQFCLLSVVGNTALIEDEQTRSQYYIHPTEPRAPGSAPSSRR